MGILTLVIGIGYAVMWNLFIYGTVPDLSQVRAFLYGSACLFAPYLANQLSNVFNPSPKPPQTNQGPAPAPASPTITGLGPASPTAAMAAQSVQITGTNFQAGVTLVLTDPQGRQRPVAPADITDVHPTVFKANLPLDLPGPWKIVVQNPPADASPGFIFTVSGPPTVTALNPAAPVHNAAAQKLTFTGIGFMSGVKVAVTDPNGAVSNTTVTTVTSTSVDVQAILVAVGVWRAVITNPGGQAAGAFQFNVT